MKAIYTLAAFALAATAGLAHAQAGGDASSMRWPVLDSKPQLRAEAKKDARTPGKVKAVGGDELNTAESDNIGGDKSARSGQTRVALREARHPDRTPAQQGGTPDLPGAK